MSLRRHTNLSSIDEEDIMPSKPAMGHQNRVMSASYHETFPSGSSFPSGGSNDTILITDVPADKAIPNEFRTACKKHVKYSFNIHSYNK